VVLVNVVYFKSRWRLEFDKESEKLDFLPSGSSRPIKADMMSSDQEVGYGEMDGAQGRKKKSINLRRHNKVYRLGLEV
jgi:serine protease inhibitor